MKKTYLQPLMKVVRIDTTDLICDSPIDTIVTNLDDDNNPPIVSGGGGVVPSRSPYVNVWDSDSDW